MTCKELIHMLSEYVDGELPEELRAELDRHLSVCPPCQHYLASFKQTIHAGRLLNDAAPAQMPEALVQAIIKAQSAAATNHAH